MSTIDNEWEKFMLNKEDDFDDLEVEDSPSPSEILKIDKSRNELTENTPKSTELYISTKSKIAYLDKEIDLKNVFWKIQVIPYSLPQNGVVKKQMKFNSLCKEDMDLIQENLKNENFIEEQIITSIDNPTGRIKFKDIRKVSVGISKKDITSYRCKKKSAFYNCFVLILRLRVATVFKEYHVKIFNTGKMEIPGVQNDVTYHEILTKIKEILLPHMEDGKLEYSKTNETVLINSNFNCGYYICRETLFDILKSKYDIQCIFDPCSYPGIQCKFYYHPKKGVIQSGVQSSKVENVSKKDERIEHKNKNEDEKTVEVSFMIFRTGSILIVGRCNEDVLYIIYEFLKKILIDEYPNVNQKVNASEMNVTKDKTKKMRKRTILVDC